MASVKIDKLTPEQQAKFPVYVEKYLKFGLCTDPINPTVVKKNINSLYKTVGFAHPKHIVFTPSPFAMIITKIIVETMMDYFDKNPKKLDLIGEILSCILYKDNQKPLPVFKKQEDKDLCDKIVEIVRDKEKWKEAANELYKCGYGYHDASWVAFYDFFRTECKLKKETEKLVPLKKLVQTCGWYLPYENYCFVSDRNNIQHLDINGRLHNDKGPALAYRDGFSLYMIHGVRIPPYIITNPERLTVDEIDNERNQEVKRVMLDKYGFENYIKNSGAKLIHSDEKGDLYRREYGNGEEPFCFIIVTDATPEPDGTFKKYMLGVDEEDKTATQAAARTFNRTPETYKPVYET
jgi:hypothetical protein